MLMFAAEKWIGKDCRKLQRKEFGLIAGTNKLNDCLDESTDGQR